MKLLVIFSCLLSVVAARRKHVRGRVTSTSMHQNTCGAPFAMTTGSTILNHNESVRYQLIGIPDDMSKGFRVSLVSDANNNLENQYVPIDVKFEYEKDKVTLQGRGLECYSSRNYMWMNVTKHTTKRPENFVLFITVFQDHYEVTVNDEMIGSHAYSNAIPTSRITGMRIEGDVHIEVIFKGDEILCDCRGVAATKPPKPSTKKPATSTPRTTTTAIPTTTEKRCPKGTMDISDKYNHPPGTDCSCGYIDLDFLLILDSSKSITLPVWDGVVKTFAKSIASKFQYNTTRFALVVFSSEARTILHLEDGTSLEKVNNAIENMGWMEMGTNTSDALYKAVDVMKTARKGVKKITTIFTDGNTYTDVSTPSKMLTELGSLNIVLGVEGNEKLNHTVLEDIAGPNGKTFLVSDFAKLISFFEDNIFKLFCGSSAESTTLEEI